MHSSDMASLCTWTLRALDFGTHREDIGKPDRTLHCPDRIPQDVYYGALQLLNRFVAHVRNQVEIDPLDDLPLELTFYLALAKVMRSASGESNDGRGVDFGIFGFPDPLQCPGACFYHSALQEKEDKESVKEAFPDTDLCCGPRVCTHGMGFLYADFEDIVNHEVDTIPYESIEHFKAHVVQERSIAYLCTKYLIALDLGNKEGLLKNHERAIQTVWAPDTFTPWTYTLALYLLHRYRESSRFDPAALSDIPTEHTFYAALYIAADLFNEDDDLYVPEVIFTRLGFPLPRERQSDREVCRSHIAELERITNMQENRMEEEDTVRELGDRDAAITELSDNEGIVIGPDIVTRGMRAKEYMGCDRGVVCTRGMLRLKEYILDRVFQWDVNFHTATERPKLLEFLKGLEVEFGIPLGNEMQILG